MACARRGENGFCIEKLSKCEAGGLEARAAAIAALAGEIWREYYTPIIGSAQL
jgi:hypothetical protein